MPPNSSTSSLSYLEAVRATKTPANLMSRMQKWLHASEKGTKVDISQSRTFVLAIAALAAMAAVNLTINLWLIRALRLSNGGLGGGNLRLTDDGLDVLQEARFEGPLSVGRIDTIGGDEKLTFRHDGSIVMRSDRRPGSGPSNLMTLSEEDKIEIQAVKMELRNTGNAESEGELLFKVSENEISTAAIDHFGSSDGGVTLTEALQTDSIRGDYGRDLRLETRINGVKFSSMGETAVDSMAGAIKVESFDEIPLIAEERIVFDSLKVEVKKMMKSSLLDESNSAQSNDAYQVCGCADGSGRIFLAGPDGLCAADRQTCPVIY